MRTSHLKWILRGRGLGLYYPDFVPDLLSSLITDIYYR
jgi:hypothetical protein